MVSARIRLSLWGNSKIPPKHEQLDWSAFTTDPNMQENYSIEVRNRYTVLAKDKDLAREKYENLIKVNNEVASELIPKVSKQRKMQFSKDTRMNEARKIMQDKYITYQNFPNNSNQDSYQEQISTCKTHTVTLLRSISLTKSPKSKMPTAIINMGFAGNWLMKSVDTDQLTRAS